MQKHIPVSENTVNQDAAPRLSVEPLNAYFWQLEQLLDRIERSQTHYQVFNLSRSAPVEEIYRAHRDILLVLRPAYESPGLAASEELQKRIKRAIDRLCAAVSVLSNFGKRVEYDNSLSRRPSGPLPLDLPGVAGDENPARSAAAEAPQEVDTATPRGPMRLPRQDELGVQAAAQEPGDRLQTTLKQKVERRRAERLKLSLPVHVVGYDRNDGEWQEVTGTLDANCFGVTIELFRRVARGTVLHLMLPLPAKARRHNVAGHNYQVYALVRRVQPSSQGRQIVGLEFLGEQAPAGFWEQPWGVFQAADWLGHDRRREARFACAIPIKIEYLDERMQPLGEEMTTTENLSRRGARVIARAVPPEFDSVRVTSLAADCCCVAAVCNRFIGKDGFERLCLNFRDAQWPLAVGD